MKDVISRPRKGLASLFWILLLPALVLASAHAWAGIDQARQAYERGEFPAALDAFRALATQEDPHAMYYLGLMAARGEGRKADPEAARYWMTKSAEAGDPDGQNTLASWYCSGAIVDSNEQQCLRWYNASAQAGNATGKVRLGQEMLAKMTKSAEAGEASAQWFVSMLYRSGMPGIAVDKIKAEYWLQRAIAPREGEEPADPFMNCYARWVIEGAGDPAPCVELALKDARTGDVNAMAVLTWLYNWDGKGAHPQPAKALYWAKRAAATNTITGYVALAMLYLHGKGAPLNEAEAFRWFMKAAKAGDPGSQGVVAYLYQEGKGVPQDFALSCSWAERAALAREPMGLQLLTWQYVRGQGKGVDLPRAYALATWVPVGKKDKDNQARDEAIAKVKADMTAEQVQAGEALVAQWAANGYRPQCLPAQVTEARAHDSGHTR